MEPKTIAILGALDTKGPEYEYVHRLLAGEGHDVIVVDTSVTGEPRGLTPDVPSEELAGAAGTTRQALADRGDRGEAMAVMGRGAAVVIRRLYDEGRIDGVLGMGGTGGTSVIGAAMRALPVGFPKVLVSTAAAGDTRAIVGTTDIVLIPSVVDVAGINGISRLVFANAAGAISGMVRIEPGDAGDIRPVVAISMFGNTTECVERCRVALEGDGYEALVFHATGTGGRTMESLVREGHVTGVLDITTTEWADELCGGVFAAGPERLDAPGARGIPHVVAPGCLDMVNFGAQETIPDRYRDRTFHVWNPSVTLMRTDVEENRRLGEIIAEKLNEASGPVGVVFPLRGLSILDSEGGEFWWPEADAALREALESGLRDDIPFVTVDSDINDEAFSSAALELFRSLMGEVRS